MTCPKDHLPRLALLQWDWTQTGRSTCLLQPQESFVLMIALLCLVSFVFACLVPRIVRCCCFDSGEEARARQTASLPSRREGGQEKMNPFLGCPPRPALSLHSPVWRGLAVGRELFLLGLVGATAWHTDAQGSQGRAGTVSSADHPRAG